MRNFCFLILFLSLPGTLWAVEPEESASLQAVRHFHMGVEHWQAGHGDQAIAEWQEAVRLDPRLDEAHYNLGIALRDRKILENRENCLTAADTLECLASVNHLSRQPATRLRESWRALDQSVRLNPNHTKAVRMKGLVEGQLERYEGAAHSFQQYLKKNPGDVEGHYLLCAAYRAMDHLDQARAACLQAVELNPDYKEAWHLLGGVELARGQGINALDAFSQVVRLDPASPSAWFNLALAQGAAGRIQDEIDAYRHAIDLAPEDPALHLNLGAALDKQDRGSEAIDHTRRARELFAQQNNWRRAASASRNLRYYLDKYWGIGSSHSLF